MNVSTSLKVFVKVKFTKYGNELQAGIAIYLPVDPNDSSCIHPSLVSENKEFFYENLIRSWGYRSNECDDHSDYRYNSGSKSALVFSADDVEKFKSEVNEFVDDLIVQIQGVYRFNSEIVVPSGFTSTVFLK